MTDIRELWIDGFGCLRTTDAPFRFERKRITLFLDDNEAGKTTLQMALLASLYGIEADKRLLKTSLRPHGTHMYPLSGPPFGTRLRLHDGARLLEVRWNFDNGGEVHVVDLDTNTDVTEALCPGANGLELGRRLLHLTIGEFSKTCLVNQDDLASVGRAAGLDSLVQRAADSQAGDSTVARAQDRLRETLRNYPAVVMLKGGGLENEIRRLAEDAEDLRRKLAELEAEHETIAEQDAAFQQFAAERDALRRETARLEYLAQVAEHEELARRVHKAREDQAALAELEAEYKTLAGLETFPAAQADPLTRWQAERLGLLRDAEQIEKTIAELRANALEPARLDLDMLGRLASVTEDDVAGIAELLGKTRDFERREQGLLGDIAREEERLAAEGASIEELDRLDDRFRELDVQDGGFLLEQERATAQAASEIEEAKRKSLEVTLRADRITEARERQREAARQWVMRGMIVAGAGVVVGGLVMIWLLAVGIALLVAGGGAGAALMVKGQRAAAAAEVLQSDDLADARLELSQLDERSEELAAEQRERASRLKSLATLYGYEQPEVLVDDYGALDELRRLCGTLILLRKQEEGMTRERQAVEAEVDHTFASYEAERPSTLALSGALNELRGRMGRALKLQQQIKDWEARVAADAERHDALRSRAEQLTSQIRAVLAEAGLADAASIEGGIGQFASRLDSYKRLRELTDILLPQARENAVSEEEIATREADAERLHRAIATQREERPSLLALEATERAVEYRRQLDELRDRLESLDAQANEVGSRVVAILSRYHAERPRLLEAIALRKTQLARARAHNDALEMAIEVLDAIGREVHGRWAEELNRSTSALLERIVPTLRDLKFDSRLHFGVWHQAGATPVRSTERSPILSAGTWDQLYLAVRLGLAEFMAERGTGGLLLLDDPFAHFDDSRFENAAHVLAAMARERHQVVIFSCQRQRFEWLRARDPAWFDANVAPRHIGPAMRPKE